jgi:hypothetical protein
MIRAAFATIATVVFPLSGFAGTLPTYSELELQARGNPTGAGFNLPNESQVTNQRPAINDTRQVAFTYTDINFDKPIWFGQGGVGTTVSQSFFLASDASINNSGDVVWRVSGDGANDGVWRAVSGVPALLTNGPGGATAWDAPRIADNGRIGYRPTVLGTQQYTIRETDGSFTNVAFDDGVTYDFLASPAFNNNGSFSARVFDAAMGGQAQIRRIDDNGAFAILAIPENGVTGFLNNTDLNDSGQVAYEAFMSGGVELIVLADESGQTTIAQSGAGGTFDDIATFGPAVNNNGIVAFRATQNGIDGVFIGDGTTTAPVALVGDSMQTDEGLAQITGFSSGIDINNNGDVVFNAALMHVHTTFSLGRGIVVAIADTGCVAGDLDENGTVEFADADDFVDVLLGIAAADPCRADLNTDGNIDGNDIGFFVGLLLD